MSTGVTHVSPVVYSSIASAGTGSVTVLCGQFIWLIYHKTITSSPATVSGGIPPVCRVYRNQSGNPEMLLDYTVNGDGDTSDSKHILWPGDSIVAAWTGGTSGNRIAMRLEALQFDPRIDITTIAGLL